VILGELARNERLLFTRQRPEPNCDYDSFDKYFKVRISKDEASKLLKRMKA
jgi:hypothetical protein